MHRTLDRVAAVYRYSHHTEVRILFLPLSLSPACATNPNRKLGSSWLRLYFAAPLPCINPRPCLVPFRVSLSACQTCHRSSY
ncbi:uncharacterized protein LY79DRAFT_551398 [Colletotrichum navitas]|uniref:Uncharacterized protein n=1 Tax=Colletotrichum navitas TaxID=681940 RepID=A0AAD8Q0L1_9PEZI|nr:uncharacterized protein LY79DRAFT_551398 [Colletotrichum navitas]KAK1593617.1 hypothetical protein LY79DRAFT_551398 [Colletotrichum navitas]